MAVDEWTFTDGSTPVTVSSGSQIVSNVPTDFSNAYALYRSDGCPLTPLDYSELAARYYSTTSPQTGTPEAFAVIGGGIMVGPTSSLSASDYLLVYKKVAAPLVADTDVPIIPAGFHLALVHGAKAEGFKLSVATESLADAFDQDFQAAVTTMRRSYLRAIPHVQKQSPAYR